MAGTGSVRRATGAVRASARSFIARSASRYICVVSTLSCPSHSAMTLRSTPASSRPTAVEWRRTCGVTCLARERWDTGESAAAAYFGDEALDGVAAEGGTVASWGRLTSRGEPRPRSRRARRASPQRSVRRDGGVQPLLPALAVTADVRTGTEHKVFDAQAWSSSETRRPVSAASTQQGVIAPAAASRRGRARRAARRSPARVRKFTRSRSKRFCGIASTRWMRAPCAGSRVRQRSGRTSAWRRGAHCA